MPVSAAERPEAERQHLQHEHMALAPGLPAAALALMQRQAPSVLRAVTEQATMLPEEPRHMTQLKAVRVLDARVVHYLDGGTPGRQPGNRKPGRWLAQVISLGSSSWSCADLSGKCQRFQPFCHV